jgi:chromosome segregation ATPase
MDSIKVQYEADIAKFHAQLKELEKHIQSVENKATSSSKKTEEAYEKQSGIVNRLKSNIQKLTEARDKSNNPKLLDLYNQKIDAANAKLKKLTTSHKEVEKNVLTLKGAIEKVTPVLAAAFAV